MMWKGLAVDGAFTLVFGTVAEIRHVGAHPVAGEKADNQAETARTNGKRNLGICHGERELPFET